MERALGTLGSTTITYVGGGTIAALWFLWRSPSIRWSELSALPWYVYLSGGCGVIIVSGIAYGVPRLGIVSTLGIGLATQFLVGALLDHYGIGGDARPLDGSKLLGLGCLAVGVWLCWR